MPELQPQRLSNEPMSQSRASKQSFPKAWADARAPQCCGSAPPCAPCAPESSAVQPFSALRIPRSLLPPPVNPASAKQSFSPPDPVALPVLELEGQGEQGPTPPSPYEPAEHTHMFPSLLRLSAEAQHSPLLQEALQEAAFATDTRPDEQLVQFASPGALKKPAEHSAHSTPYDVLPAGHGWHDSRSAE